MTQINLTKNHIKTLKAKAHYLKPVVILGDKGLTDSFLEEAQKSLSHHELIKIKLAVDDKEERDKLTNIIITKLDASLIQRIGKMIIVFKRNNENPKIILH